MQETTNKYQLFFDISSSGTKDYQKFCPMNVAFDQGETLETWFDLCSKFANNVKVGLDPTWSVTAKFDKTDPVAQFIMAKELAVGTEATASTRIVNLLKGTTGKQIDFIATFSGISYTAETETVLEVSFDLKIYKNSTFVETNYTASV